MDPLLAFIPIDRQLAIASLSRLPYRTRGAALFADLSGFTPLTEALVRALGPQRGAEELTRQLNLVYDALIGEVENYRGTVIGFSGDAITCWFDDGDSQNGSTSAPPSGSPSGSLRALAAALAMQSAMEKFASVALPNGVTVTLALKAAVVSGDVRRFTVGDPEIQLIDVLAGATLDRLAKAEHHADKGEVLTDQATAELVAGSLQIARWDHEHETSFAVIDALASPVEPHPWEHPAPGVLALQDVKPWVLPPVFSRLTSGQASFLAELRPAVSVFVRFGGIDYENDPAAGARLDAYIRWVQQVIARFDGILVQLTIGDKGSYLYAAFGAPVAHDDDAVRAIHAANALRRVPPELSYIPPPQIGISRGRMRVGAYGGTTRRTYGVLGDEVNVAARLMQAAEPGQILVTERVSAVTDRFFTFERLAPLRVKGKTEPLGILSLSGARTEVAQGIESEYTLPLVGRVEELNVIQQSLDHAASGHGQVILFYGEAGVGKTRLAFEALRRATRSGFEEYRAECPSYGTNSSYLVWHHILRAFFRLESDASLDLQLTQLESRVRDVNPALVMRLPLLGPALNLPIPENDLTRSLDGRVRKQLLEGMLVEYVRAKAEDTPRAFLLEDCQWIDALSNDLLETLARETTDRPVLLLATLRPPDLDRIRDTRLTRLPNTTVMQLGDFSTADAARLIELKLQQETGGNNHVEPLVIERLTAHAGGNPFYIEELLNYVRDRRLDLRDPNAFDALDLPDSLSSLILSRIDQLTEPQRSTLKVASIIGRQFFFRWLWGVYPELGEPVSVRTDLDDMSRLDLTPLDQPDPQRSYIFRHVLTQQVTYESTPYSTRAELHGQLGHYLELQYADDIESNVDLLAHHYDRSAEMEKRREYLRRAGEQAQAEYANDAAISYYRRLLPLLDEPDKIELMLKLGQVYEVVGEWDQENVLFLEGLELAARWQDAHSAAHLRAALGKLATKRGNFGEASRWFDEARRGFQTLGDRAGIGQVLHESGTLAVQQNQLDKGREFYQASLEIRRALGEQKLIGNLLSNLGIIARFKGDTVLSTDLHNQALELRRSIGDRWGIAISLNNIGVLKRQLHDYDEACLVLEEALEIWREIGDRMNLANTLTSLGEVLIDQQQAAEARVRLKESLTLTRSLGDKRAVAFLLENFAFVAMLEGDGLRALELVGAAGEIRQTIGAPIPEAENAILKERLAAVRARYADAAVTAALAAGRALTVDQAIQFALAR